MADRAAFREAASRAARHTPEGPVLHRQCEDVGADTPIDRALCEIERAIAVQWVHGHRDHDLEVRPPAGPPRYYQVPRPRDDTDQPPPIHRPGALSVQAAVRRDLIAREEVGIARYGIPLQPHNGRDALRDAYAEALDLACYLKQAILERANGGAG